MSSIFGEESVRCYLLQIWPEVFIEQEVSVTNRSERTRHVENAASTEITGVRDASVPTMSDESDGFVVPDSLPDASESSSIVLDRVRRLLTIETAEALKEDIKRMVKEEIDHRLLAINAKLDLIMEKLNGSN